MLGRILELKSWLVKLNKDIDAVNFDDILVDLKLTPDVLELPVPRYFTEDRKAELEGRAKFLEALVEKYDVATTWEEVLTLPAPLPEEEAIRVMQVITFHLSITFQAPFNHLSITFHLSFTL